MDLSNCVWRNFIESPNFSLNLVTLPLKARRSLLQKSADMQPAQNFMTMIGDPY